MQKKAAKQPEKKPASTQPEKKPEVQVEKKNANKKDSKAVQKKPKEEEKKIEEKPKVNQQAAPQKTEFFKTIQLTQMLDVIEEIKNQNKTSLIIDPPNQAFTFFKYKGNVIDLSEYFLQEQMQQGNHADYLEKARKQIMLALKGGSNCVIYLDKMIKNLNEYFKGASFWQPAKLFSPVEVMKEEFYKKEVLKPEEDVDYLGNKGNFIAKKDFSISILLSLEQLEDLDKLLQELGLSKNNFLFIKIEQK